MISLFSRLLFVCFFAFTSASVFAAEFFFDFEPTAKATVITPRPLEENTALSFFSTNLKPNETLLLQRCGIPCNTAKLVHKWAPVNGMIFSGVITLTEPGTYYFWLIRVLDNGEVGPVMGENVTSENNSITAHFSSGTAITVVISKPGSTN